MTDERAGAPPLDLPSREEVEFALELAQADRAELPGLYRMNVRWLPMVRLGGFTLALLLVPFHNLHVLGGVDWGAVLTLAAAVEAYCLVSWLLLRLFFARLGSFHLGTLFVWTDLLAMTAIVYASGGERSLLWPIYFIRVADQMWLGRARAVALAVGGVACYALLVLWLGVGEGRPLDWGVEGVKLAALVAMSASLAAVARQPWSVRERTTRARDLILRLERQSVELDHERGRAEAASRAKSDFLARMSHELRTPLNSVVGFTNVLLRKAEGRDREYLKRIQQNGVNLLELIDDILDLARIEEGRIEVVMEEVDLAALVRETVGQLEGRTLGTELSLGYTLPPALAGVRADEARLRQVLVNLVGNALKFTERGSVQVEVEAGPDGREPRYLRVRDTGIGIPADRLPYIFHAFEQADGTTSRKYGGAGLGLAICRSLCELMGFELTAESRLGEGSVFTVALRPAASPTSPASRPA